MRRQESDGDGGAGKRRSGRPKWDWLDSIRNDLWERELSRRTCKTGLDVGVSQDTSTPHKSGERCRRRRLLLSTTY